MYFLLAGVVDKFRYLRAGLAIVLTFIGVKMLLGAVGIHIKTWISLVVVALVLISSVVASILFSKDTESNIHVDLPPDFDSSQANDSPEEARSGASASPDPDKTAEGRSRESEDRPVEKVH